MQFLPHSLDRHLSDVDSLTLADLLDFSKQILNGLEHIKECGLVHRDVKCDNILVMTNVDDERAILKIADLGSAQNNIKTECTSLVFGTLKYMAPEMLAVKHKTVRDPQHRRSSTSRSNTNQLPELAVPFHALYLSPLGDQSSRWDPSSGPFPDYL